MSFSDIFKKTFLDGFSSADISIYTASAAMLVTPSGTTMIATLARLANALLLIVVVDAGKVSIFV